MKKKSLLKLFLDVCILLALLAIMDLVVGLVGDRYARWLNVAPRISDAALINYDLNAVSPDVAIIGSSTAICHYVPSIIHDSLLFATGQDYEVFNMGMSKQRMAYNYYALKSVLKRKHPKIVIEDVWASNVSKNDYPRYFEELRPYINSNIYVKEMLVRHDAYDFKMKSRMYCYNTELVKMLMASFRSKGADGFHASTVQMPEVIKANGKDTSQLHPISIKEFDAMVDLCVKNKIKLFVVLSPAIRASDVTSASYLYMKRKCEKNNVPFMDYSNDERYFKKEYFADPLHMNVNGAELFTKELMKDLKKYLK